jgi:PRTRC genetic system protein C
MENLLEWTNIPLDELKKLKFKIWQLHQNAISANPIDFSAYAKPIGLQLKECNMALEIKGLKRVFKLKKGNNTLKLDDPNPDMLPVEVMDFYSMTYPELTTATPHGPLIEEDCAVYEFKTTIGTKG